MSALINHYFKRDQLEYLLSQCDDKGISITSSVNDETGKYGQNVATWITQSKEDREAKVQRKFISNGAVVFTDGKIFKAVKENQSAAADTDPF
jgi:hypothetical protein